MEEASFESLVCRGYEQIQGWLSPGLFLGTLCLFVPDGPFVLAGGGRKDSGRDLCAHRDG